MTAATAQRADLRGWPRGWHPLGVSFTLQEVATWTGGRLEGGAGDVVLERLVTDSRQAGPGALFVALKGEVMDGHQFIPAAVDAGVSAILCSRTHGGLAVPHVVVPDTQEALVAFSRGRIAAAGVKVVGVTGSAGKTTTKEMIAAVLAKAHRVHRTEGNLNTYTGLPMNLAHLQPEHDVFVAEYGMSALGEIALLTRMARPDIAVVLNVGLAHVGLLGSIENVARAKRELVEGLNPDGVAILNADDPRVAAMASSCPGRVVFFGLERPAAFTTSAVDLRGIEGSTFQLETPAGTIPVKLALPGRQAVSNALAAAAVGQELGVALDDIAAALHELRPVKGRLNLRPGRRGATIIDDAYNASPGSMEASLEVLRAASEHQRIAVLGDMLELGDEAPAAHRRVGGAAARAVDRLIVLGDHAVDVAAGAREAGMTAEQVLVVEDVDAAVAAIEPVLPGSTVLVKASRGMALERVVEALAEK